ncbi:NAD kinase [Aeromicrobium sp. 636]|uniref:NAD kinase n=1 Tax=Aeromicrobium senzhongii TaxID=2663859 RepID=A0A8I0JZG9_9ACTN|nr:MULTISPECIES: NAD kinase [Aeromicrobium]MBC9224693.1 NAD kinase [Aeromicrobium senzhongii]MCQ3996806.1 NAD kinase [Aeromicrobium sp. 636]
MRSVLLAVHVLRDGAPKLAADFARSLQAAGIEVRALTDEVAYLEAAGAVDLVAVAATPGAATDCELAVVFGGDGTILRAAELCRGTGTPLLGVNLGHVGFLAEADEEDLADVARHVIAGGLTVEERLTVDVQVFHNGEIVATNWALNEASVEKASRERMLEVVVEIDGRPVSRMGCDGVVCATPTGSTAYNFSAGGPVVWPEVSALLMVPISAHALFARPMVVSPESTLAVEVVGHAASGILWCDGRRAAELPIGARVEVRRGVEPVRLARVHPASFADRLVRKFELPVAGWRGSSGAARRAAEDR